MNSGTDDADMSSGQLGQVFFVGLSIGSLKLSRDRPICTMGAERRFPYTPKNFKLDGSLSRHAERMLCRTLSLSVVPDGDRAANVFPDRMEESSVLFCTEMDSLDSSCCSFPSRKNGSEDASLLYTFNHVEDAIE